MPTTLPAGTGGAYALPHESELGGDGQLELSSPQETASEGGTSGRSNIGKSGRRRRSKQPTSASALASARATGSALVRASTGSRLRAEGGGAGSSSRGAATGSAGPIEPVVVNVPMPSEEDLNPGFGAQHAPSVNVSHI